MHILAVWRCGGKNKTSALQSHSSTYTGQELKKPPLWWESSNVRPFLWRLFYSGKWQRTHKESLLDTDLIVLETASRPLIRSSNSESTATKHPVTRARRRRGFSSRRRSKSGFKVIAGRMGSRGLLTLFITNSAWSLRRRRPHHFRGRGEKLEQLEV